MVHQRLMARKKRQTQRLLLWSLPSNTGEVADNRVKRSLHTEEGNEVGGGGGGCAAGGVYPAVTRAAAKAQSEGGVWIQTGGGSANHEATRRSRAAGGRGADANAPGKSRPAVLSLGRRVPGTQSAGVASCKCCRRGPGRGSSAQGPAGPGSRCNAFGGGRKGWDRGKERLGPGVAGGPACFARPPPLLSELWAPADAQPTRSQGRGHLPGWTGASVVAGPATAALTKNAGHASATTSRELRKNRVDVSQVHTGRWQEGERDDLGLCLY